MGATAAGLMAVSGLVSGFGASQSASAASSAASYQSQVDANNAQIAAENAKLATSVGESQAEQSELQTRATAGSVKAAQGANYITTGTGSAAAVNRSVSELGMLDAATIRSNAARNAYGFETQQMGFQAESQLQASAANEDTEAGDIGFATSLLGGATSGATKYAQWSAQTNPGSPSPSLF